MGYQLNKPDLRREMEHECNLVAAGLKRKEVIMTPILAKMKDCFQKANAEAHKLDEVAVMHFPILGSNTQGSVVVLEQFNTCGFCRTKMQLKETQNSNASSVHQRKLLFCASC